MSGQQVFYAVWAASLVAGGLAGRRRGQTLTGVFAAVHAGPVGVLLFLWLVPAVLGKKNEKAQRP